MPKEPPNTKPVPGTPSNKPKRCYIVTSGSYSDYMIHAVFSTRDRARTYIRAHNAPGVQWDEHYAIEAWDMDVPAEPLYWCVGMNLANGNNVTANPMDNKPPQSMIDGYVHHTPRGLSVGSSRVLAISNLPDRYIVVVSHKTKAGAIHLANEKRAAYLITYREMNDDAN